MKNPHRDLYVYAGWLCVSKEDSFRILAILLREDHLAHCSRDCSISLSHLMEMAEAAGARFTRQEQIMFPRISVGIPARTWVEARKAEIESLKTLKGGGK
jgi:hypothetical protein